MHAICLISVFLPEFQFQFYELIFRSFDSRCETSCGHLVGLVCVSSGDDSDNGFHRTYCFKSHMNQCNSAAESHFSLSLSPLLFLFFILFKCRQMTQVKISVHHIPRLNYCISCTIWRTLCSAISIFSLKYSHTFEAM